MQCWLPLFLCAFLCVCAHDAAHALPVVQNDRSMTGTVTFTGQGTPNLTSDPARAGAFCPCKMTAA